MSEQTNSSDELIPVWARILVGLFLIGCVIFTTSLLISAFSGGDEEVAQPQRQIEIAVSSQSVKELGGKYRYFFNIKNNDIQAFSGDIKIIVLNTEGESVYDDTFSTSQPLVSGGGTSVYIDANTGPTSVHGSYGVQTYSFTAKVGGEVVKTGSGTISALVE